MIPTVTLYGERGTAVVNEADAPAWINAGWSRDPLPEPKKQTSDQTSGQTSATGNRKSGVKPGTA